MLFIYGYWTMDRIETHTLEQLLKDLEKDLDFLSSLTEQISFKVRNVKCTSEAALAACRNGDKGGLKALSCRQN